MEAYYFKEFLISFQQPIYFCQISNRKVPERKKSDPVDRGFAKEK